MLTTFSTQLFWSFPIALDAFIVIVCGLPELLTDALLHYDALTARFRRLAVRRNRECPLCGERPTITALREKWAWAQRPWTSVSADTGIGNPSAATADKGARYVDALADRVAQFLVELSQVDPAAMYQ